MNELTKRYISDFMKYLRPEQRDGFITEVNRDLATDGEIVKIEDTFYPDGKRISTRIYHTADGSRYSFNVIRMGAKDLEPLTNAGGEAVTVLLAQSLPPESARKPVVSVKRKPLRAAAMEAVPA